MSIVTFNNVEKAFAGQRLFTTVSFSVDGHDHAVLVGRNGTGKTTLLRLVSGDEHADSGTIARARGRRIWLHEQTPELERDRQVREYLLEAFGEAVELEAALRATEERLSGLAEHSPELRDTMKSYQQLQRRFEAAGGYGYRDRLGGVVEGLGLPDDMLERSLLSLSGGELTRVTLAQGAPRRRRPAPAGRADEPPRHRLRGVAGDVPLGLRARLPAGDARPPPAREGRAAGPGRGARARRDAGRRLRHLPARERGAPRPHAPRVRAGHREDRAAAAVLRPVPRQEGQGQAGQGQAHADRAHQGRAAGAPQAEAELQARAPAAQALRARRARAEGAGRQRRLRRRPGRRPHPGARRRRGARARREGRPAGAQRLGQDDADRDGGRPPQPGGRRLAPRPQRAPGLLLAAGPGAARAGHRAADGAAARRPGRTGGAQRCSAGSSSARTRSRSGSRCSRAASAAASACSRSSSATPTSCCSTSPPTTWTWARSRRWPTRSRTTRGRSCWSPTTGTSSTAWRPACSRSTTAACSTTSRPPATGRRATSAWASPRRRSKSRPAAASAAARPRLTGAAATRGKETAEEARRRRARLRGAEAAVLSAEKRLGEIDAELAEPGTYADRDVLNRLLDERGIVEGQLQREYATWEKLVDEQA